MDGLTFARGESSSSLGRAWPDLKGVGSGLKIFGSWLRMIGFFDSRWIWMGLSSSPD